jgi:hypothetical protein
VTTVAEALQLEREWRDPELIARAPSTYDVNACLQQQQRLAAAQLTGFWRGFWIGCLGALGMALPVTFILLRHV